MEPSDLLDVLFYFLDEDMRYSTVEELKMHNVVRQSLYRDMFGVEYAYGTKEQKPSTDGGMMTAGGETKGYIPPTEMDPDNPNPFGSVLDAPVGY